jgi:uncharacterized protein (DUF3084 family)
VIDSRSVARQKIKLFGIVLVLLVVVAGFVYAARTAPQASMLPPSIGMPKACQGIYFHLDLARYNLMREQSKVMQAEQKLTMLRARLAMEKQKVPQNADAIQSIQEEIEENEEIISDGKLSIAYLQDRIKKFQKEFNDCIGWK